MIAMQVKRVPCPPAVRLIGKITPRVMRVVLAEIEKHGGGEWRVAKVGRSRDGDYFTVEYKPTDRSGTWLMTFGMDGSLWCD